MSGNHSDSVTCVSSILNSFKRKASPNRLEVDDRNRPVSVATKLDFDKEPEDMDESENVKRQKIGDAPVASSVTCFETSVVDSPWETRRLKRDLINAKSKIASLETRVSQLHALRRELEVVFEAEKNCLLQQQERDQMMIQGLESRIAQLRRRESDVRDSTVYKAKDLEDQNFRLEQRMVGLKKEKAQLADEVLQLKRNLRNVESKNSDYEAELNQLKTQLEKKETETQSSSVTNVSSHLNAQNERLTFELKEAQRTIKDLEYQLEDSREASANVKAQHQKLLKIPCMEHEIENLRSEVSKLRDAVYNKLLLEEEVTDLRQKCASSDKIMQNLVQLEAEKLALEKKLAEWNALLKDFCSPVSDDYLCPSLMRKHLQELQQSELLLSSEVADLQNKLKSSNCQTSKAQADISRLTLEVSRLKTTQEQQGNLIRRWQKKLALVTGERNSYREQLDAYEKELTLSVSSQQQSTRPRIEALEKSLQDYRELVESLEADLTSALGQGGAGGLLEKLRITAAERDCLVEEKANLQKRVDELQLQMEHQVAQGNFNPIPAKILHLRMNPVAKAEEEKEKEMTLLKNEVAKLRERVKILQEGEREDITCKIDKRLTASNNQEVQELREQIKSADLMMQRLKEVFKKTSSEFRDCVYNLLGYKVDRLQNKGGLFRLSSIYAESPSDYLLFKMEEDSTFNLLETAFSESVGELIDTHLRHQGSLPVFHAAVTMDLFSRQSMMAPSGSADEDDPIVVLD